MLVLNVLSGSNTHYIFLRSLSLNRVQLMGVARSKDRAELQAVSGGGPIRCL